MLSSTTNSNLAEISLKPGHSLYFVFYRLWLIKRFLCMLIRVLQSKSVDGPGGWILVLSLKVLPCRAWGKGQMGTGHAPRALCVISCQCFIRLLRDSHWMCKAASQCIQSKIVAHIVFDHGITLHYFRKQLSLSLILYSYIRWFSEKYSTRQSLWYWKNVPILYWKMLYIRYWGMILEFMPPASKLPNGIVPGTGFLTATTERTLNIKISQTRN